MDTWPGERPGCSLDQPRQEDMTVHRITGRSSSVPR
jgi:hypothetical protein